MQYEFHKKSPKIAADCFVAPNATLIGDVTLGTGANIWFGAVLRADSGAITVGEDSNVQDNAVVHMDEGGAVVIGKGVTVGHGAIVHGCTVGDNCLIGMGATLLNNCVIGEGSIIGAGALVPEGMCIPSGSLAVGVPAKIRGTVSEEQARSARENAAHYVQEGNIYAAMLKEEA